MKSLSTKIGFALLLSVFSFKVHAHVGLDYPLGGETFIVGESILIQWHVVNPHETLNWDLLFSSNGGETWETLQLDIPLSQLSYEWVVPYEPGIHYRVRVIQDNEGQNYHDNSLDFVIAPNTDPPILDEPANDLVIACNPAEQEAAIQAWLDNHGGASVTHNCGELVWTHDYAGYSDDCGATGNTLVIFTAEDDCGMLTTNALLTIADTSPPVIEVPAANTVVESNGLGNEGQLNFWLDTHGGAEASDVCGDVTWSHNFSGLSQGCGATGEATVTFTATDECGNTATTVATFTIADQIVPTIVVLPHDTVFICDGSNQQNAIQPWLDQHGGAEVTDIGGDVLWSNNYSGLSDGCGETGVATVVFTATDVCGNSTTVIATVSVEDHTAPIITIPAMNTTLECDVADQDASIQQWLANNGGAQASDECGEVTWNHNFTSLNDGCGASGFANVIFTATDECGNSSTSTAFIHTEDNLAPLIETEAQEITIVCGMNDSPAAIQNYLDQQGGAMASDLCGNITWSHNFPALSDTCGPLGTYTIRFTATDDCGNAAFSQTALTIVDSLMTSIFNPEDLNLKIYPNPASDDIRVSLDKSEFKSIALSLFDTFGNLYWSGSFSTNEMLIPVSQYPRGVYVIELSTNKGSYSQRVVVQ